MREGLVKLSRKKTARKSRVAKATRLRGLSVWRSPTITRFALRLLGTLPRGGTAGNDLVLARAYGATIQQLGGIPYGASGSPVYQGKRLLGAIATVFAPDDYLAGITPIEAMLALTQEPTLAIDTIETASSHITRLPLTAQGLASNRALMALEQRYGRVQDTVNIGFTSHKGEAERLQPGESIGAALMLGDIQLGYIGTATLIQGRHLFAFGHPLLFTGPTSIPLTRAPIITTVQGDYPQKVGSFGEAIGTIVQDRSAGVLAELGAVHHTVHMRFTIQDNDRQQQTTINTQAANVKSELPFLSFIGAIESMQRAMNRIGAGSADWQWRLTFTDVTEPIETGARQSDANDIGFVVALSGEVAVNQALATSASLESIELTATVSSQSLLEGLVFNE